MRDLSGWPVIDRVPSVTVVCYVGTCGGERERVVELVAVGWDCNLVLLSSSSVCYLLVRAFVSVVLVGRNSVTQLSLAEG